MWPPPQTEAVLFVADEPAALAGLERASAQGRMGCGVSAGVFFLKPLHAAGKSVASMRAVLLMQKLVTPSNKGLFPDLLSEINNGIGGQIKITYTNSTIFDNRDRDWTGDPWTAGAKSLLPFPVYVVTSVTVNDGIVDYDPSNDQKTTYGYSGGMFDPVKREFRGFNCVSVTDAQGTKITNYFHQGGGRDGRTKRRVP